MKFIEDMKQRPEEERIAFAVMMAGGVGLLLFLLWGFVFFNSVQTEVGSASSENARQTASVSDSINSTPQSERTITQDLSVQYQALLDAMESEIATTNQKNAVELYVDETGEVQAENVLLVGPEQQAQ